MATTNPRWSELHDDVLGVITKKLSFPDLVRFSAVCSLWRTAAKSHNAVARPVLLAIPGGGEQNDVVSSSASSSSSQKAFSLDDDDDDTRVVFDLFDFNKEEEEEEENYCIGSSKAVVVLLDKRTSSKPVAVDPFSRRRYRFPSLKSSVVVGDKKRKRSDCTSSLLEGITNNISKAVVVLPSSSSSSSSSPLVLVVMYGCIRKRLAYCSQGSAWASLDGESPSSSYEDVVCSDADGRVYALSSTGSVEAWDFRPGAGPTRARQLIAALSPAAMQDCRYSPDKYFERWYLGVAGAEFWLARRFVGNYVGPRGELLEEADLLTEHDTQPLVCPYRTIGFRVYGACLDGGKMAWEERAGLGAERALFVGGSETGLVWAREFGGVRGGSVYFTDDNWEEIGCDYLYGGHDIGRYCFGERVVKSFWDFGDHAKLDPPPFWLIPKPL